MKKLIIILFLLIPSLVKAEAQIKQIREFLKDGYEITHYSSNVINFDEFELLETFILQKEDKGWGYIVSCYLKSMQKTTFEGNFEMNCFPHPLSILNKPYQ